MPSAVAEFHDFGQEIVLEAGLRRDTAVLVPGVAVAGDGKGLDDIAPKRRIPGDVFGRVGIGPQARPGKPFGPPSPQLKSMQKALMRLGATADQACQVPAASNITAASVLFMGFL